MPLLIIAGISERSRRQGRQTNWSAFPWPIKFIFTGKDKWAAFSPCIPDLMKELSNAPQDGAHVLAFNNDVSRQTQDALRGRVGDCTHLAFADPELISAFGKQRFTDFVNAHIASENEWRNAVCPTSTWSPLLLPEKTFRAARGVELMWTLTRRSDARPETLAEAALRIREFCDKHERKEKKKLAEKRRIFLRMMRTTTSNQTDRYMERRRISMNAGSFHSRLALTFTMMSIRAVDRISSRYLIVKAGSTVLRVT